jgi:hypothetical protein
VSVSISTQGHFISSLEGGGAPVLSNFSPSEDVEPGQPGGFPLDYTSARNVPFEFDITGLSAGQSITMYVRLPTQTATYMIMDFDGNFLWPFSDGASTIGDLGMEPVHVKLIPIGGWPPGDSDIEVASCTKATE